MIKGIRLITLDATGTIFKFKEPPLVYANFAQKYQYQCDVKQLETSFYHSLKSVNKKWPHFGGASNVPSERWWNEVIHGTFKGIKQVL